MTVDIYNSETKQFIKTISQENLFEQCGNDDRMYNDIVKFLKTHRYIKSLNEIWILND